MNYRIYNFTTKSVVYESDDVMALIKYFNTEYADYNNCVMQVYDVKNDRYKSIGC